MRIQSHATNNSTWRIREFGRSCTAHRKPFLLFTISCTSQMYRFAGNTNHCTGGRVASKSTMSSKGEPSEPAPDVPPPAPEKGTEENEKLSNTETFLLVFSLCVSRDQHARSWSKINQTLGQISTFIAAIEQARISGHRLRTEMSNTNLYCRQSSLPPSQP